MVTVAPQKPVETEETHLDRLVRISAEAKEKGAKDVTHMSREELKKHLLSK